MIISNDNNVDDKGLKALCEIIEERKKECKSDEELLLLEMMGNLLGIVNNK